MEMTDEELIKHFAGLDTQASTSTSLIIPQTTGIEKQWNLCLLVKVCTNRIVFESQFKKFMRRAWNVKPPTVFRQSERGSYLVEFSTPEERTRVLNNGPWIYCQDLVAVAVAVAVRDSEDDLNRPIEKVEL